MTRTLGLGYPDWDLHANDAGMISVLEKSDALTQNVSNKCRAFFEDMYLAYDEGMPHLEIELGKDAPEALVKARYRRQAMLVDGVMDAQIDKYEIDDGELSGRIVLTFENGDTAVAEF